jgi:secreted PhoX family phosphatase
VQRINLTTGAVETILTGTSSCDPLHATPWGTIVFGEENGNTGQIFELKNPLGTTGVSYNRTTGVLTGADAGNVVRRDSLGRLAFEGFVLLPNGVAYYGDENRPATGTPGGAYFKFVPTTPWTGGTLTDLTKSPLASGSVYGLRLGKRSGGTDYGQGTQTGLGTWVQACSDGTGTPCAADPDLRAFTATAKLTGFYRPEDLQLDIAAFDSTQTVKVCGPNTGNEGDDHNWGEVICISDGTFNASTTNTAIPELQNFVIGTSEQAMMDNVAFQPGRKNWIFHEDGDIAVNGKNNDLWSCLPDGADADSLSDGCIRIATLNDRPNSFPGFNPEGAEWTGGVFDATGKHFYVSVQHNVTGKGVVLDITGWK